MWPCPKCLEMVDEKFEVCWNCGTSRDGVEDPDFERVEDSASPSTEVTRNPDERMALYCLRCHQKLKYAGTRRLDVAQLPSDDFLATVIYDVVPRFNNLDAYVCPKCGHLELFVDGVGDEYRPH